MSASRAGVVVCVPLLCEESESLWAITQLLYISTQVDKLDKAAPDHGATALQDSKPSKVVAPLKPPGLAALQPSQPEIADVLPLQSQSEVKVQLLVNPASPSLKPSPAEEARCWSPGFEEEVCCDMLHGPEGVHSCWDDSFTFQRCCILQASDFRQTAVHQTNPGI